MSNYKPEGQIIDTEENQNFLKSLITLREAERSKQILEARAIICDQNHNLIVDLGFCKGMIPRVDAAIGIEDGSIRDIAIISRVNKPVCFKVIEIKEQSDGTILPILSRKIVQEECCERYISKLRCGDIISARVTHLEPFGCFVDIGCGISSLIPIDAISISRISHPSDRFFTGQDIKAIVRSIEANNRILLTHKELLGSWSENAVLFKAGETVAGIVRSVEEYGVFVELTPNLAGLAEPHENVYPGQQASIYIKSLIPEKMKVKLIIVDSFDCTYRLKPIDYFVHTKHLDIWKYSPDCSEKLVQTVFDGELN